jgi:hypothetical protein
MMMRFCGTTLKSFNSVVSQIHQEEAMHKTQLSLRIPPPGKQYNTLALYRHGKYKIQR